jgi:acyl-CoA thioesterase
MEKGSETDTIKMIREKDIYAIRLGIEILEAANGRSKVTMPIDAETANATGNVHGGAIFSLADQAFATAANSEGILSVAIQANIHYQAPCPSEGRLYATGEKVSETKRLGFYHMKVFTPDEKVIALMQAIVYKKL